jgi:hypothetical protein
MESKKVSLYEYLTAARRRRKYYLQHRLKTFIRIDSRQMTVKVTEKLVHDLPDSEKVYLQELVSEYGYNIQFSIPN